MPSPPPRSYFEFTPALAIRRWRSPVCGSTRLNGTSLPLAFTVIISNRQRRAARLGIHFRCADIGATSAPSCIYENLPAAPGSIWAWNNRVPVSWNFWCNWCHSKTLLQKRDKDYSSIEEWGKWVAFSSSYFWHILNVPTAYLRNLKTISSMILWFLQSNKCCTYFSKTPALSLR